MKIKFKEPLESFLKKEGVKKKFVNNIFMSSYAEDIIDGMSQDISNLHKNTITGAFVFKKTTEGSDFWWDISDKWQKYIYISEVIVNTKQVVRK